MSEFVCSFCFLGKIYEFVFFFMKKRHGPFFVQASTSPYDDLMVNEELAIMLEEKNVNVKVFKNGMPNA